MALHVDVPGGLVGALQRSFEVGGENLAALGEGEAATRVWQQSAAAATQAAPRLAPLVSLTLYLCSAPAEVREARGSARQPARPQPMRTKKGVRLFPPPQPTTWEVAYRLGAALRQAQQLAGAQPAPDADALAPAGQDDQEEASMLRQRPRAHIRRAHWHTYWVGVGSRADPSKAHARVRWLPPIPVGLPDELIPTIRPVT